MDATAPATCQQMDGSLLVTVDVRRRYSRMVASNCRLFQRPWETRRTPFSQQRSKVGRWEDRQGRARNECEISHCRYARPVAAIQRAIPQARGCSRMLAAVLQILRARTDSSALQTPPAASERESILERLRDL